METAVSYMLMLQMYINSKQKNQKNYVLCLGNVSKDFTINNMKKNWIKRSCNIFFC